MNTKKQYLTLALAFTLIVGGSVSIWAQNKKKQDLITINDTSKDVVMTWNKTTPESEMNDDVKALKKYGVTINYSDVKRNVKNEITGLKVSYEDEKGNRGELKLNQQSPISTISFYKAGSEIGFGTPANSNGMENFFFNGVPNGKMLQQFGFHDEDGNPSTDNFQFNFSDNNDAPKSNRKSKIVIKKPNKKDLIIEDGEVISGADDYTAEEIEKIKKDSDITSDDFRNKDANPLGEFDLRNEKGVQEFKKKIKKIINSDETDTDEKSELAKAKEEMIKAKEELEKARIALEKANKIQAKKK
ncbi:hypothetical protein [Flavobacterium sp.]|uniref:hypothetical protein n=1 Tax=Flavobacterium sp. TaxID=239 RepID=UPI00286EB50B|nr:hypothetical protein [Flavobacterium sp.]